MVGEQTPLLNLLKLIAGVELVKIETPVVKRVGINSRPTFDLIADGSWVLNQVNTIQKIEIKKDVQSNVSSLVAERIKDLLERTLSKISSDTNICRGFVLWF